MHLDLTGTRLKLLATHKTSAAAAEAEMGAAAAAVSSELGRGFASTSRAAESCEANAPRGGEPATRKRDAYVHLFVPIRFLRAGAYCGNNWDWSASK